MNKLLIIDLGSAWGGQEIYSQNLVDAFVQIGFEITHVSSQIKHKRDGIKYFHISNNWSRFFSNSIFINKLLKDNQLIVFNGNRSIQQSALIRKKIKFIGIKHGPFSVSNFGFFGNKFLKILYFILFKKLDKLICIAKVTFEECQKIASNKVKLLPNGVHGPNVENGLTYSNMNTFNLIFCGRLVEDKGVILILNVVLHLFNSKSHSIRLDIYGNGPLREEINIFIKNNNLGNIVFLHGFVDNRDIIYNKNKPSLMLFASKFEGMPLSILEAFSYGVPVLAFKAPGVSDIINDGFNGILIDDKNFEPDSMIDKLRYLFENKDVLNTFSVNCLESFKRKYSFDTMFCEFQKELI